MESVMDTQSYEGLDDAVTIRDTVIAGSDLQPKEYILAVGRIVPEKGFQDLIKAYRNSKTNKKLVIVGDTTHKDDFYHQLISNESNDVKFLGFRKGQELKSLYRNAALFVLPSYHEGLPIVILEALSYSLPVLVSDIPPSLDVGLKSECYFPCGDIAQLTEKLDFEKYADFLNDEELIKKYDWQSIVLNTLNVYETLVNKDNAMSVLKNRMKSLLGR